MKKQILTMLLICSAFIGFSQGSWTIDQNYDHSISQADAAAQTFAYRHSTTSTANKAATFTAASIEELKTQPGYAGLKCYFSHAPDGHLSVILVAVDQFNNDILSNGIIKERGLCCTNVCLCGNTNALNTD